MSFRHHLIWIHFCMKPSLHSSLFSEHVMLYMHTCPQILGQIIQKPTATPRNVTIKFHKLYLHLQHQQMNEKNFHIAKLTSYISSIPEKRKPFIFVNKYLQFITCELSIKHSSFVRELVIYSVNIFPSSCH